ncbi:tumor protein p53-inducible nuclear protein 1-like isoform X1 [Tubulanus polymorphus]|uniref:tumor protein p53-inducible nuclear protein 1-like isoform X1 n=1 Tax=Tubulanus polymorphus TaxID=672921 RepID=UPI003DA55CBF
MLSGIANWVFGASEDGTENAVNEINLKTTVVDDEWTLVDKENCIDCNDTSPTHSVHSNNSEDSWLVTPPACFTAGQQKLETSSMENLLIEHPSMSVYHTRGRPGSAGLEESSSTSSNDADEAGPSRRAVVTAPHHRPRALAHSAAGLLTQQLNKPMQRATQKIAKRNMSKNKLNRVNKVHDYHLRSGNNLRRKQHFVNQPNKRKC